MTRLRLIPILLCAASVATSARAQTCLGYPAQQTGNINFTLNGTVGQDFGGGGAALNLAIKNQGPFIGASAGANHYVVEPKETVMGYAAHIGLERYNKDNLIWCPIISVKFNRGEEVD